MIGLILRFAFTSAGRYVILALAVAAVVGLVIIGQRRAAVTAFKYALERAKTKQIVADIQRGREIERESREEILARISRKP